MAKTPVTTAQPAVESQVAPVDFVAPSVETQRPTVQNTSPKLTTRASDEFGAKGRILDLTAAEIAAAPEGLLADPTPDQLALRRA